MRKIIVCIGNCLMSEAIMRMLKQSGEFEPVCVPTGDNESVVKDAQSLSADIILTDVSYASGATIDIRMKEAGLARRMIPGCRLAWLCDENSMPDLAREVALAKRDGIIDAFFYSSVTDVYLAASLMAL